MLNFIKNCSTTKGYGKNGQINLNVKKIGQSYQILIYNLKKK